MTSKYYRISSLPPCLKLYAGNASPGTNGAIGVVGAIDGVKGAGGGLAGNSLLPSGPYRGPKNSSVYDWKKTSPGVYTNPTTYSTPANASRANAASSNTTELLSQFTPAPLPTRNPITPSSPSGI